MSSRRRRLGAALAAALGAAVLLGLAGGADAQARDLERIESDLEEARQERGAVQDRIDRATRAYEELVARIAELEADTEQVETEVDGLRTQLQELDEVVTGRLRAVFKHGSNIDPLTVFLASEDPQSALTRAQTVQRAVAADRGRTEELAAAQARYDAAAQRLDQRREELDSAREEQADTREELQAGYQALGSRIGELQEEQRAEEARLERERRERERREREEAARQRATGGGSSGASAATSSRAPTSSGGMACPLDQPRSFIDSWGHPRSGGRAHRGTDLMGPLGIPVRAITDGVWDIQRPGRNAGLWAILRAPNGDQFWYLHLDSHTVADGARVSAGQQVGTNGSTGNAVAGAEHVHFEHHPGGGRAINPYPLLRSVCG